MSGMGVMPQKNMMQDSVVQAWDADNLLIMRRNVLVHRWRARLCLAWA
jgi:hypothetical protein